MNKAAKKYYKKINHMFPTHSLMEKKYLKDFKGFLTRYSSLHPDKQYQDYIEEFGEPQDVISSYYEKLDNHYVISQMKISQFMQYFLITFCVIMVAITTFYFYLRYQEYQYFHQNLFVEETIETIE